MNVFELLVGPVCDDVDPGQGALQTGNMSFEIDQLAIEHGGDFICCMREEKPPVERRYHGLFRAADPPVQVYPFTWPHTHIPLHAMLRRNK